MQMDFDDLLHGPIYATGLMTTEASLLTVDGDTFNLTVIDLTEGAELQSDQGAQIQTLMPAADVRVKQLKDLDLAAEDLYNAQIELNGKTWRVHSYRRMPGPQGGGEVRMFLMELDDG